MTFFSSFKCSHFFVFGGLLIFLVNSWMDDQRLEAGSDWRSDIGNGILAARVIGTLHFGFIFSIFYTLFSVLG